MIGSVHLGIAGNVGFYHHRFFVAGKNILGRNVTNRLLPVATQLTRGLGLAGHVTETFHHRCLNRFSRFGTEHGEDKRKIPYI